MDLSPRVAAAVIGVAALSSTSAAAGESLTFTPELQLRPRVEADTGRDGDATKGDVVYISQRTRFGGTFAWGSALDGRVLISDVRVWGEEADTRRDFSAGGLDVRVAALRWSPTPSLAFKIGRDEVKIHEQRLMAVSNWRQPGRSFDGVQLAFLPAGSWRARTMWFLVQEGDVTNFSASDQATPAGPDSWGWFTHGGWHGPDAEIEALAIVDHRGAQGIDRLTGGLFAEGARTLLSARVEGYAQVGQAGDDAIKAWMAGARGTATMPIPSEPSITLWYDRLSGDPDPTDGVQTAFDTLYGGNHAYYGHMDIATYKRGGKADGRGLQDAAVKLAIAPGQRLELNLDGHLFAAADGLDDPLIGAEVDGSARIQLTGPLSLSLGSGWFQPLNDVPDGDAWGWMMLDLKL